MDKKSLATYLEQKSIQRQVKNLSFFIGFDGFTDHIYRVVKSRKSPSEYERMDHMQEFAERIMQAGGKSTNLELVLQEERLGGNGPILANSINHLGAQVSLVGALGYPKLEPLFEELSRSCKECISIAPSGITDAFEFNDGKLLLGKHTSILSLDEKTILDQIGKERLCRLLEQATIFASANWTMLFGMTAFWKLLEAQILPQCTQKPEWMFVDLADPAKRLDGDILDAMNTLTKLQKQLKVVLGLNVAEAERIAKVMKCQPSSHELCQALQIEQVVIHAIQEAEASDNKVSAKVTGPYVKKVRITTGGGDNFNAGYLLGCGLKLDLEPCLYLATYTSGYYVEHAKSPTLEELIGYLKQ